jgi:hypothetical protein
MMRLSALVPAVLLLAAPAAIVAETEDLGAHARHPMQTVVIGDVIRPQKTDLRTGEVIVFQNHSVQPVVVTFTEPADLKQRIRCALVRGSEVGDPKAPWQLFTWQNGRLVATIPPGRFAAVCSLAPGTYAYQVVHQGGRAAPGELPDEGSIVVN